MKYSVSVESAFSAAHALRGYKGRCENLHGHNWKVKASVEALKTDDTGMVVDFSELKKTLKNIIIKLDHKYLNEVEPFDRINPTAENIATYVFNGLKSSLADTGVKIKEVEVWESETSSAKAYE